jgi:hypothetical protein
MVDRRIKPYFEEQGELARRAQQVRAFRRNQAIGVMLVAAMILIFWLCRAPAGWIFPTGWWRP